MFERTLTTAQTSQGELLGIGRLADGRDQAAGLHVLLQTYRTPVVHFLYRMIQDRVVAEDLAGEVFLRLYDSVGKWSKNAAPETQLFRIAAGLVLGKLRNETSQPPPDEPDDVFADVRSAVISMPGKQRAAVLLHKYHKMDCGHIAKVLDCSESAAKSLLWSAYDLLRRQLTPCEATETWD